LPRLGILNHYVDTEVKVSFHIAQDPVLRIAQSALLVTSLTPSQPLWEVSLYKCILYAWMCTYQIFVQCLIIWVSTIILLCDFNNYCLITCYYIYSFVQTAHLINLV